MNAQTLRARRDEIISAAMKRFVSNEADFRPTLDAMVNDLEVLDREADSAFYTAVNKLDLSRRLFTAAQGSPMQQLTVIDMLLSDMLAYAEQIKSEASK